ncbi:MAG TPA: hypothetical protein VK186_11115 [Candidatus Deferrimicrobium sp.]|nr:hypothetical protein [Candidatus Deferrimicrobium sp.]
MNKKINQIMVKSILGLMLVLLLKLTTFPLMVANWRECVSAPGCGCTLQGVTSSLQPYIVESAGYFLNSHSDYQTFLNRVEMAENNGADTNEWRAILNSAVANMEKAKAAYANVKAAAGKVTNDPVMIDKLAKFDYDGFQVKYGLIVPIFEKVKTLLVKGDMAGLDDAVLANMDSILNQLYEVRTILDNTQTTDIALLWRLNQSYAEAQLSGQYISEIIKANL